MESLVDANTTDPVARALSELNRLIRRSLIQSAPEILSSSRVYYGGPSATAYTIPEGQVLHISMVHAYNTTGASVNAQLKMGGFTLWGAPIPAFTSGIASRFPSVLYEGEILETVGVGVDWGIYGALLRVE